MGKGLIITIIILVIIISGGILYYFSLPKTIGKELNFQGTSCIDSDGDNIKIKGTTSYESNTEIKKSGSIMDYCTFENGKNLLVEGICEGSNSYIVYKTCGWFGKCSDGRCA